MTLPLPCKRDGDFFKLNGDLLFGLWREVTGGELETEVGGETDLGVEGKGLL